MIATALEQQGQITNQRVFVLRNDGLRIWCRLSMQVFSTGRNTECIEGMLRDISDVVALEKEVKEQGDALEKLNMEMDRFIYSASHDIRAPVATILGLINIMRMEMKDRSSVHLIELMTVSVSRLERFIDELTKFAKTSKKEIKNLPVDFNHVMTVILGNLSDHPDFLKVTIQLAISQDKKFYSDVFRVRLILQNILKNALDFIDPLKERSTIDVQIMCFFDRVEIRISDNGIGISEQHLDKVFRIFYRGTNQSKGSGMGLYTAKEALHMLGGSIFLESGYGEFTKVVIGIPNSVKGMLINKKDLLKGKTLL